MTAMKRSVAMFTRVRFGLGNINPCHLHEPEDGAIGIGAHAPRRPGSYSRRPREELVEPSASYDCHTCPCGVALRWGPLARRPVDSEWRNLCGAAGERLGLLGRVRPYSTASGD